MNSESLLIDIPEELQEITSQITLGHLNAARRDADRLLATLPSDHYVRYLSGLIALAEGKSQLALKEFRQALHYAPSAAAIALSWNGIGRAMLAMREYTLAQRAFRCAMHEDPARALHAVDFAQVFADAGNIERAESVLKSAVRDYPQEVRPYVSLARVWTQYGRPWDALMLLRVACRLAPSYAPAHLCASTALVMLGEVDAAYNECNIALELDPTLSGYYQLASLGPVSNERIMMIKERVTGGAAPSVDARIDAGFALALVHAKRREYDMAFASLERANALKHSTITFSPTHVLRRVRQIQGYFDSKLLMRFMDGVESDLRPIFIVGMPRSGSTLIEQMLAMHPEVQACGELPYLPRIWRMVEREWQACDRPSRGEASNVVSSLSEAATGYAKLTESQRHGRCCFTDKLPGNYLFLGLIDLIFPRATIIHARRDPFDTCVSCYEHLFTSGLEFTYDLRDLGFAYRLYEEMMTYWHSVLRPKRILDVEYEAVVAEPEAQLRRILAHCGLAYDPTCLDFPSAKRVINTASACQVRRPIYKSSIGRWRNYRGHLSSLAQTLGRRLPC